MAGVISSWTGQGPLVLAVVLSGLAIAVPGAAAATDGSYQDVYWVNGCASGARCLHVVVIWPHVDRTVLSFRA